MSHKSQIGRYLEASQAQADGPFLFALLLGNQNNNNGLNGANPPKQTDQKPPIGDTVRVLQPLSIIELKEFGALEFNDVLNPSVTAAPWCRGTSISHESVLQDRDSASHAALTDQQLSFWHQHGYLIIDNALTHNKIADLISCVHNVAEKMSAQDDNTCQIDARASCEELNPSGKVMANLLHNVGAMHHGDPIQNFARIGIGLHRALPPFRSLVFSYRHQQIAVNLGFKDPRVSQCLVVTKAASGGAAVIPHQDSCSNFQNPTSSVTFWYALQDTTLENGCLEVAPGTHRTEPIVRRTHVDNEGNAELIDLDEPVFYGDPSIKDYVEPKRDADGRFSFQSLPVMAGTLILMHGHLLHRSQPNRSTKNRIALNFSVVEGGTPWPDDAFVRPYNGWTEFEKLSPK